MINPGCVAWEWTERSQSLRSFWQKSHTMRSLLRQWRQRLKRYLSDKQFRKLNEDKLNYINLKRGPPLLFESK